MTALIQDIRFAVRTFVKNPGFALITILALGLGIGANTTIFTVVNGVLLQPLPFKDSSRIVRIFEDNPGKGFKHETVTGPNFADWRSQMKTLDSMAVLRGGSFVITGTGDPESAPGGLVTADYFRTFGVTPVIGRTFAADEFQPGHDHVVMLTEGIWKRRFASDPAVLGQTITLNSEPYTVVGVLPTRAFWPFTLQLYTPLSSDLAKLNRRAQFLNAVGRLRAGVGLTQAQAELSAIAGRLEQEYPKENTGWTATMMPIHDWLVGDLRLSLLILLVAVGLVLSIACVNVANLLLARAAARERELAIRTAMGASRRQLVRQLLSESLLLSFLGGGVGLLLAFWGTEYLVSIGPDSIPRIAQVGIDRYVLGFAFGISTLTGLFFGLLPALQTSKRDPHDTLRDGGRTTAGAGRLKLRSALVVSELALGIILLIGAGLMIQSFRHLQRVDVGFNPANLVSMRVALPLAKYPDAARQAAFFAEAIRRIRTIGNTQASLTTDVPLSGAGNNLNFVIEGQPPLPPGQGLAADYSSVGAAYFKTLEIGLEKGRVFSDSDQANSPRVVVVNEAFEHRFFANENVLGQRISGFEPSGKPFEIVGVVKNVRNDSLSEEPTPKFYAPFPQAPAQGMNVVIRTSTGAASVTKEVEQQIWSLDKDQPINNVTTLDAMISGSVAQPRLNTILMGLFAISALILATIGIYGVISYSVLQRTNEIGLRMALGAKQADVLRMILAQGLALTGVGIAVGLAGAFLATRAIRSLLFGVTASDPLTFVAVPLLLAAVALLACYIPARRAMRIDPMTALRHE